MSISVVRKQHPDKFVFCLELAAPGVTDAAGYSGILPVQSIEEMRAFEKKFRLLLLSFGGELFSARKPPKGMVQVRKVRGEEGE